MKVQRRHLTQHKAAECSKRLVPCRYCSKEFVADTLQVHHTKCGRFPVACPNQCDASILAREDLDLHLKDQCPVFGMCCPFRDAGCRFKVSKGPLCFFICCGPMLACTRIFVFSEVFLVDQSYEYGVTI